MTTYINFGETSIDCNESDKTALEIIRLSSDIELNNGYELDGVYTVSIPNGFTETSFQVIRERLSSLLMEKYQDSVNIPYELRRAVAYDDVFSYIMDKINGESWLVSKGSYCGTWIKRFSSYFYKNYNLKLEPSILSELGGFIGKIKPENSREYYLDLTNRFNWDSGDYGDSGSCYWGCRENAKETIYLNGGLAVRFYHDKLDINSGYARAWILPFSDSLLVFNGYGMETINIARVLATFIGKSYKRVSWLNSDRSETLWINSDVAYVITDSQELNNFDELRTDYAVLSDENTVSCHDCGEVIAEDDSYYIDSQDYHVCRDCKGNYYQCGCCGYYYDSDNLTYVESEDNGYCQSCIDNHFSYCDNCGEYFRENLTELDGYSYCQDCIEEIAEVCSYCGELALRDNMLEHENGSLLCSNCDSLDLIPCSNCGELLEENRAITLEIDGELIAYCKTCFNALSKRETEKSYQLSFTEFIK